MKKVLSILFIAIFALQTSAQNSNLTVFSEDGLPFYLILNGIRQNENPETNVRIDGLINPYYTAKVIFADQSRPSIEKKMLLVADAEGKRGEVTYKVKANKKGVQVMRYYSFTPAAQVVAPPAHVTVVNYHSEPLPAISLNTHVSETTTTSTTTSSTTSGSTSGTVSESVNVGINVDGFGIDANINITDPLIDHSGHNHEEFVTHHTTTTTTTTNVNTPEPFVEEIVCQPMERNLFQSALSSIEKQSFSDSKLSQAKQITSANCLSASQIKSICSTFDFESSKLEYAKFAYQYCFDQNNYWQINESFDFDSSVEELNEYIRPR